MEHIVRIHSTPKDQNPTQIRLSQKKSKLLAKITEKFRGSIGFKHSFL